MIDVDEYLKVNNEYILANQQYMLGYADPTQANMREHSTRMDNAAVLVNVHGAMVIDGYDGSVYEGEWKNNVRDAMETVNILAMNMSSMSMLDIN